MKEISSTRKPTCRPKHAQDHAPRIVEAYRNRRTEISKPSRKTQTPLRDATARRRRRPHRRDHRSYAQRYRRGVRREYGGFGDEPKFPHIDVLEFVVLEFERTRDPRLERILSKTLRAMSQGGAYDHIEGGFFRYSTTRDWSVPHFEKMAERSRRPHSRLQPRMARFAETPALRETLLSALFHTCARRCAIRTRASSPAAKTPTKHTTQHARRTTRVADALMSTAPRTPAGRRR